MISRKGQADKDRQIRTGRIGQAELNMQSKIGRTRLPREGCQERTTGKDCQDRTVRTAKIQKKFSCVRKQIFSEDTLQRHLPEALNTDMRQYNLNSISFLKLSQMYSREE
jgi:hypothetical protein